MDDYIVRGCAGMYFDAVLDSDLMPVFNGTPEETLDWIEKNLPLPDGYQVAVGKTMSLLGVQEYLDRNEKK